MIDPRSVVSPQAQLAEGVSVGPFTVIGPDVVIGARTRVGPHVVIEGHTRIGADNEIFQFASIGAPPQDKKYKGEPTRLLIGDEAEVERFYVASFKDMRQSSCKVISKAFVKFVEPKKQSHTKGDTSAPPWWPDTRGDQPVRHKEPDHLLKPGKLRCSTI